MNRIKIIEDNQDNITAEINSIEKIESVDNQILTIRNLDYQCWICREVMSQLANKNVKIASFVDEIAKDESRGYFRDQRFVNVINPNSKGFFGSIFWLIKWIIILTLSPALLIRWMLSTNYFQVACEKHIVLMPLKQERYWKIFWYLVALGVWITAVVFIVLEVLYWIK